jgi:hypothetical protein
MMRADRAATTMGTLTNRIQRPVLARRLGTRWLAIALLSGSALLAGCRTSDQDLRRWATSDQGPAKLIAVLLHDKYSTPLRVQAALALVGMKPRPGQQAGVDRMMDSLQRLSEAERTRLISQLVPQLIAEIDKPPPTKPEQPDTTLAFKDAAYALLTNEGKPLLTDPAARAQVESSLSRWATTSFAQRLDDTSQKYGVVQVMRHLGANGVATLPALLQPGATKIDSITALIAELGDPATKLAGSQQLVALARHLESPQRFEASVQSLMRGANPLPEARAREQTVAQQNQELMQVFGSMKRLGQPPTVSYLLSLAADSAKPDERRAAALAALEGHLEPRRGPQLDQLFALAEDPKTPVLVRDLVLRRMADLPRQEVVSDLYRLFDSEQWKTRWLAAELVLRMSELRHLSEFMDHLEPVRRLTMVEAKRYGALIAELKGATEAPGQRDLSQRIAKYVRSSEPRAVRLTALGYYLANGSSKDISDVARHERDATPIPKCEAEEADCAWQCSVEQNGKTEEKGLTTLGDFVHFCVLPALRGRSGDPAPAAEQKGPVH